MNILIGDIGNTTTKLCLVNPINFNIIKIIYLKSENLSKKNYLKVILFKNFKSKLINKNALFSSVVPKYFKLIKKFFKNKYKINLYEIKDKKFRKIIKINIKNVSQVGSDRIANSVGAFIKYKTNCIILDFGTATTFDVVTKKGIYSGGVIAPGVNLSIKALSNAADQIPSFFIKKQNKVVGKNTIEALRSGFYWGYSGLINNIILKIEKDTQKKYKIVFTGGYAELFKSSIIRSFTIDRNITIKGIIEIYKKNEKYFN
jgi:type III pantothenate kinase